VIQLTVAFCSLLITTAVIIYGLFGIFYRLSTGTAQEVLIAQAHSYTPTWICFVSGFLLTAITCIWTWSIIENLHQHRKKAQSVR
jgi:hypothetical protein